MIADTTEDGFLGGRLRLRQPRKGHRAGHDAMLLAAATDVQQGDEVVELGAGVGAAGLALARRGQAIALTLVDVDENLVALARENAALNAIPCRAIALDVTATPAAFAAAGLSPDSADRILMNPPFNAAGRHQSSPDRGRRTAHVASASTLELWIGAARRLLRPRGTLTLIWRPEGMREVLDALSRGFGGIAVLPVHPRDNVPAIRMLVKAEKGSAAPVSFVPALVLNDPAGRPTSRADAVLRGEETLRLAAD